MQAVKRNKKRFSGRLPADLGRSPAFKGKLCETGETGKNIKYPPYAFTEQGVAMLSSILRSDRAVYVNIEIRRALVRLRPILASHPDLARKLDSLEKK